MDANTTKPSEQAPLQVLQEAVETWIAETGAFYDELHERLETAHQHIEGLQHGSGGAAAILADGEHPPRAGNPPPDAERLEMARELEALRTRTEELDRLQARVQSLEEALEEERNRAQGFLQALETTRLHDENAVSPREPAETLDIHADEFEVPNIPAFDSRGHKQRLGTILVEQGIITEDQLQALLQKQSATPHMRLGALAIERGYTNESLVARVLAAQLRLPYVDLQSLEVEAKVLECLSSHLARLHRCLPLRQDQGRLTLAMANPVDLIAIEDIELATRLRVDPVVASATAIATALERLYPASG